jgi:hypothetical protein
MDPDKHLSPFARHALRAPDDGAGAAPAPEPEPDEGADDAGDDAPADQGGDPEVPQEVLNKLASKIRREERKKAQREAASQIAAIGKAVSGDGTGGKDATTSDLAAELAQLREDGRLKDAFNDAASELTLTRAQRAKMLQAFKAEKPDDADEWVEDWVETWGLGAKPATAPEPAKVKKGKRDSDGGATRTNEVEAVTDPTKLTLAMIEQMRMTMGEREANMKIRNMVRDFARTVTTKEHG